MKKKLLEKELEISILEDFLKKLNPDPINRVHYFEAQHSYSRGIRREWLKFISLKSDLLKYYAIYSVFHLFMFKPFLFV